ncbi:MAG: bifunctional 3-deoxy-7-phosphoheptulonate synthase/chorismate mutase type II [Candidatus Delongbacteria bacterium]|jgi:chorismate mutase|nr:bifunctional 3-deoxy-7-phosphoheptulonate synthase/chorismate mutase type II [Candidatus Delongbacteria bacterium]
MEFEQGFFHKQSRPFIIAGPCSAESETQMLKTAEALAEKECVHVFRSGIWKPRTHPGYFEGAGDKALKWLSKVKNNTGLLTATEVITPEHAERAMEAGIDVLWIGARTTGNPIYVQALADVFKGTSVKLMVKNPLHPDINLWCGAIQRFYKAGIKDIAAVHRGFYPFEKTAFRNLPLWEIPIDIQLRNKNLPVFCDPSHIAGKTNHIATIAQQAMDLNMSGLMVEVHYYPENALTDKQQQLRPEDLVQLLDNLTIRKRNFKDQAYIKRIVQYRKEIDQVDYQLLDLLKQRQDLVEEIAVHKKNMDVNILQLKRWESIIKTRLDYAEQNKLSKSFVLKLLQAIHKEAIRIQTGIMHDSNDPDDE